MRAFSIQILLGVLLFRLGFCQFKEQTVKSSEVVNAKLKSIEITPDQLFEAVLTFEILVETGDIAKGTIVSCSIDENNGVKKILKKISQYGEGSLEIEDIGPLVVKLLEIDRGTGNEPEWWFGWVATPARRKSLELLETKIDSFFIQTVEDYKLMSDIEKHTCYTGVLLREEDGFLMMQNSRLIVEIPYHSGKWHFGTYLKHISTYKEDLMRFEVQPDNPKLFWEEGNKEVIYFRDLWNRMIQFKLD
ncbi:MAG: hypothetical protein AAGF85_10175 [Bacteroidota bacterium]